MPLILCNYNGSPRIMDAPGSQLSPELFARLVDDYPHVIGLVMLGDAQAINAAVAGRVKVRSGGARPAFENLLAGGYGFLSTEQNIVPRHCASMCDAFHRGDVESARRLYEKVWAVSELIHDHKYPRSDKPILRHLGFEGAVVADLVSSDELLTDGDLEAGRSVPLGSGALLGASLGGHGEESANPVVAAGSFTSR